jgi:hypothetical protein
MEHTVAPEVAHGLVGELLIVDRDPWALELFHQEQGALASAGRATVGGGESLRSRVLPLQFELVAGESRPQIRVVEDGSGRVWLV